MKNPGTHSQQHAAFEQGTAVVDLSEKTILRLSGKDPIGMLEAILTNTTPEEENAGAYAALLDHKGRIQTDLRVIKSGEDVLVVTEPEGAEAAKGILGRYAPFSRVKLEEPSGWMILGLYGPRAKEMLGGPEVREHESAKVTVGGVTVLAAGASIPVSGYDLIGTADALHSVRNHLLERGATPAGPGTYETARIEAGVPRFGSDLTPENFPGEANDFLERAVSFGKGCYPGQETVARMRYRGHPNRTLHRFAVEGEPPAPGAEIIQGEKRVGTITSVAPLPVSGKTLALGYLHRKADLEGSLYAGGAILTPTTRIKR